MNKELIEEFKNREIKAKQIFVIDEISKNEAYEFIRKYHYLGDAKFFCKILYINLKLNKEMDIVVLFQMVEQYHMLLTKYSLML